MKKRPEDGYESLSLGDYQERLMNKLVSKKFLPAIETYARRNGGSWVCVWSASFFPISSGRCLAWQPPASNARQVAFDSNPNMASLGFSPFHPSRFSSFPFFFLTFLPSFFRSLPTYLPIYFSSSLSPCLSAMAPPSTDKSEFSSTGDAKKEPHPLICPIHISRKEEPFKPI